MKKIFIFLFTIFIFFLFTTTTKATYDPTSIINNHFGIHIIDPNDLKDAAKLVNSQGGDWGYVTFVIQKGERDTKKWQQVFDNMRRLHLIPIVRIATAPIPGNEEVWEKGNVDEIDGWVSFLNSLNWVIKNRYVVIGNEPNHASEWGGKVNPKEYADYLKTFSQKLKNSNDNFFIMPAGFDASAPNSTNTMDESLYIVKMLDEDPEVFKYIDGWASHSYPNPNFSGSPQDTGKGTIDTFAWELNYLKYLGITKNLPVFITETGWTHKTDSTQTDIGPKFEYAFKNVWSDKKIVAVTPFILNYINPPFDIFSWKDKNGQFYDFYNTVQNLSKIKGQPIQEESGDILTIIMPRISPAGSQYDAVIFVKNTGQSIWDQENTKVLGQAKSLTIKSIFPKSVEPQEIGVILVSSSFPNTSGSINYGISLSQDSRIITNTYSTQINLIPKIPTLPDILTYLKDAIIRKLRDLLPLAK